jgi:hypothetical protein
MEHRCRSNRSSTLLGVVRISYRGKWAVESFVSDAILVGIARTATSDLGRGRAVHP